MKELDRTKVLIKNHGNLLQFDFSIFFENKSYSYSEIIHCINNKIPLPETNFIPKLSDVSKLTEILRREIFSIKDNAVLAKPINYSRIKNTFKKNNFIINCDPELESTLKILSQDFETSKIQEHGTQPSLKLEILPLPKKLQLRGYQIDGHNWLMLMNRIGQGCIQADDMGLGKTIMAIATIYNLLLINSKLKAIVVAPSSVISNWTREFGKYLNTKNLEIFQGPDRDLYFTNPESVNILLTSYSTLSISTKKFSKIKFDIGFFDEGHNLKNSKITTYKNLDGLNVKHRVILSGTPIENNIDELWSLVKFVSKDIFPSLKNFKAQFAKQDLLDPESYQVKSIRSLIRGLILRREKKDVLEELPEKIYLSRDSEMTDIQKELTQRIVANREEIALVKFNQFIQIVSHPSIFDGRIDTKIDHSSKMCLLEEILGETTVKNNKTIIFTRFLKSQAIIANLATKYFKKVFIINGSTSLEDRSAIISESKILTEPCCLVLSYRSSALGLNLQHCDIVLHFDKWWNPQLETQAEDRAYRMGRKGDVIVYNLSTLGSIDEYILDMQKEKKILAENIMGGDIYGEKDSKYVEKMVKDYEENFKKKYSL